MAIIPTYDLGGFFSSEETQRLLDRMLTDMIELEVELESTTTERPAHLDRLRTDNGDPLDNIFAEAS